MKDGRKVETAVEAPLELREVAGEMLLAHPAADTYQASLQVAQDGVHPGEGRVLGGTPASGHDLPVVLLHDCPETPEPGHAVRQDVGSLCEAALRPSLHGPAFEVPNLGQLHVDHLVPLGAPVRSSLDGRQKGGLPGGPSAPAAVVTLSAHVGVVQLHPFGEDAAIFPFEHDVEDLLLHPPGGLVGDPDLALQFHGRKGVLAAGKQVHGQEPGGQRQVGSMEDGSRGDAGLRVAGIALVEAPPGQSTVIQTAAFGAYEALRPAEVEQSLNALLLGAELVQELREGEATLELAGAVGHRKAPRPQRQPQWCFPGVDKTCPTPGSPLSGTPSSRLPLRFKRNKAANQEFF